MFLRRAKCGSCDGPIPVNPGLLGFRLPPYVISCAKCGASVKTGFMLRATWLSWLVCKTAPLPLLAGWIWIILLKDRPVAEVAMIAVVGFVILVIPAAFILSYILPIFIQPFLDIIHAIVGRKSGPTDKKDPDHRSLESDDPGRIFIDTPARSVALDCMARTDGRHDFPIRGDCLRICPVPRRPKRLPSRLEDIRRSHRAKT